AVLPIHTEAVATMAGRADLLGGVAVFLTWLLALGGSASRRDGAEAAGGVVAANRIAFLALFSNENVPAVLPLILVGRWLLRSPLASLSIFFFLLTLLPGSNFFFPAEAMFSERTAYTASFGYVLFLGALSQAARGRWRVTAVGALCILFALYLARTWERSQAWASP